MNTTRFAILAADNIDDIESGFRIEIFQRYLFECRQIRISKRQITQVCRWRFELNIDVFWMREATLMICQTQLIISIGGGRQLLLAPKRFESAMSADHHP